MKRQRQVVVKQGYRLYREVRSVPSSLARPLPAHVHPHECNRQEPVRKRQLRRYLGRFLNAGNSCINGVISRAWTSHATFSKKINKTRTISRFALQLKISYVLEVSHSNQTPIALLPISNTSNHRNQNKKYRQDVHNLEPHNGIHPPSTQQRTPSHNPPSRLRLLPLTPRSNHKLLPNRPQSRLPPRRHSPILR